MQQLTVLMEKKTKIDANGSERKGAGSFSRKKIGKKGKSISRKELKRKLGVCALKNEMLKKKIREMEHSAGSNTRRDGDFTTVIDI